MRPIGVYWRPNDIFVRELIDYIGDKRVLEVFAGNGYLASFLNENNVNIKATSILSSMDAHEIKLYHDVENINAVDAVLKYRDQYDILLVCWPTVTDHVIKAARLWGKEIIFIGEVTDYKLGHLGGCATDEFFDEIEVIHEFQSYQGNYIEKAMVVKC